MSTNAGEVQSFSQLMLACRLSLVACRLSLVACSLGSVCVVEVERLKKNRDNKKPNNHFQDVGFNVGLTYKNP
jgi:hypothetical protein